MEQWPTCLWVAESDLFEFEEEEDRGDLLELEVYGGVGYDDGEDGYEVLDRQDHDHVHPQKKLLRVHLKTDSEIINTRNMKRHLFENIYQKE